MMNKCTVQKEEEEQYCLSSDWYQITFLPEIKNQIETDPF